MKGRVLIVAGSDSGGGAGVQGDVKTVTALGGYAASAITAVTVQNTVAVSDIHGVPPQIIRAQIDCVLADIGADAIKTGMVWRGDAARAIAAAYDAAAAGAPMVVDPVLAATAGADLAADDLIDALKTALIPRAAVATPNIPEAEALTGISIKTRADMERAAAALCEMGARAVLLKGGHLPGDRVEDLLLDARGPRVFADARIRSRNTHGTGCALASAIATGLAQGMALDAAVARARAFVRAAIRLAPGLGRGAGPLNHGDAAAALDAEAAAGHKAEIEDG